MINGKVVVTVNESDTNTVLASATLDELWGFAIGRNSWSAEGVPLTPASSVPEGMPKVCAHDACRARAHAAMPVASCAAWSRAQCTGPKTAPTVVHRAALPNGLCSCMAA